MKKRIVSCICTMVLMVGIIQLMGCDHKEGRSSLIEAVSSEETSSTIFDSGQKSEFDELVYYLLRASGMDMEKEYSISQAYKIYREPDYGDVMYFVFSEGICVGELWGNEQNEGYAFFQTSCDEISDLYTAGIELSVISPDKDHIYVVSPEGREIICVYGIRQEGDAEVSNLPSAFSAITLTPIEISALE